MDCTSFKKLVFKMREAQKNYFATRERKYLQQAKALEKKVDETLKNGFTPKLF